MYWKQIWQTNNISVTVLPSCWQGCHCRVQYNRGSIVLCTTCRYHGSIITQTTRTIKVKWRWSAISSVPLTFFIFTVEYINCKVSSGRSVRTIGLPLTLCMQYVSQNSLVYIHILNYILVLGEMNDRNMKVRNQIHTCMYSHQNWSNLLCKLTLSIISLLSVTSNYCNTNKHSLQFNPMQSNPADLFIKVSVLFLCSTFETTL